MNGDRKYRPKLVLIATCGLVIYLALTLFSEYWLGVVTEHDIGEDFHIYYKAYTKAISGENPYLPYDIGGSFVNHPFVLSFVSLFSWHRQRFLATFAWVTISAMAWVFVVWLVFQLARAGKANEGGEGPCGYLGWILALFLNFAPFWETIHIGQINVFVVLSLCLMFYYSEREESILSGVFLALAIVLKTSPIVFVFYYLTLRRFRLLVSSAFALLLFSLIPALQFSPRVLTDFWAIIPKLGAEIHPTVYNQSILSLSFRVLTDLGLENVETALIAGHRIVMVCVFGTILAPNLLKRRAEASNLWGFSGLLVAMTVFSPLVWYHHLLFLILPLAILLLRSNRGYTIVGIILILVIQLERVFEYAVVDLALPDCLASLTLLGLVMWIHIADWWKRSSWAIPASKVWRACSNKTGSTRSQSPVASSAQSCEVVRPLQQRWTKVAYWLLFVVLIVLYLAWPLTHLDAYKWTNDEGAYLQMAALANAGHPLYTETLSNKPPLLVWVLQLAFWAAGPRIAVARSAVLCLTLLGFIAVGVIARRLWGKWAGLMAMGMLLSLPEVPERAPVVHADLPAMTLALVAMGTALLFRHSGRRGWVVLSGAAFTGTLLIHLYLIYIALPLAVILFLSGVDLPAGRPTRRTDWLAAFCFLGAAFTTGLLALAAIDSRAFFDWVFLHNYEASSNLLQPLENWHQIAHYLAYILPLVCLSIISVVVLSAAPMKRRGLLIVAAWWVATSAMLLACSPLWDQYLIFLVYPLVITVGGGLAMAGGWVIRKYRGEPTSLGWRTVLAVSLLVGMVVFAIDRWNKTRPYLVTVPRWSSERRAARVFLESVVSADRFVATDDPYLTFAAGKRVVPSMTEASRKWIRLGRVTTDDVIDGILRYRAQAVLFGTGRLEELPGLEDWVASVAAERRDFGRIRVYLLDLYSDFAVSRFGQGIELRGYTLASDELHPGCVSKVMLVWQSSEAVSADYHVFVHLVNEEGYIYGQHDGVPGRGECPTGQWAVGQRVFDAHPVEIGQDIPPGRYRLFTGMYGWPSLERLPAFRPDGSRWPDDQALLGDFRVVLP
jgi:4-amino-4-deoxy-L-arabinose transferase-like glycosyltransferase